MDRLNQIFNESFFQNTVLPKLLTTIMIVVATWVVIKLMQALLSKWQTTLLKRVRKKDPFNYSTVSTRFFVIKRCIIVSIYFFAFVFFFLQFDALRDIGSGLLASAGVAGIVIGMASQNILADILAGISISFSQPVRLDDAVIFDGEFGWIEEISLMHLIIRTWDNRRIVVPNNVFSNKVIQNWTMKDESLLGVVMMYVDYTCELDQVKQWVEVVVNESEFADDEKVAIVQVVDFTEKAMVLRLLAKGPDAPSTWNLRCEIREKVIKKFKEHGLPLPKIRVEPFSGGKVQSEQFPIKPEPATVNNE